MTFCLTMRLEDGLVGIADTRITTGNECITARKVTRYQGKNYAFFIMSSGLRSVRDKTLTYFDELFEAQRSKCDRLFKVCNFFTEQLRKVGKEDREALELSKLSFNMNTLVGGQMPKDKDPKLYLIYPEGNWVEVGTGTPYAAIGNSGYGKPVLDRTLHYTDSMQYAFRVGCMAFDSTRISAADVDYPLDAVIYPRDSFNITMQRYDKDDFRDLTRWWQERLRQSVQDLPFEGLDTIFDNVLYKPSNLSVKRLSDTGHIGVLHTDDILKSNDSN